MTAQLTFNLPEEQDDFQTAVDGYKYSSLLYQLDQELRNITKYYSSQTLLSGKTQANEDEINLAEKIREYMRELAIGMNVSID